MSKERRNRGDPFGRASCKMKIFVQNQGMRKKLPQAYSEYVEDNFLSTTQSLGEKIILQEARKVSQKKQEL
jgi:hypothetical protein